MAAAQAIKNENTQLKAQLTRQAIEGRLVSEFAKRLSFEAARDQAELLAGKCTVTDAGDIVCTEYGSAGAEAIARTHLAGRGNYLLKGVGSSASGGTAAPAAEEARLERAIADVEYSEAWKKEDPAGYNRCWDAYLKKVASRKAP